MNTILTTIQGIKAIKISKFYTTCGLARKDFKALEAVFTSGGDLDRESLDSITKAVNVYYDLLVEVSEAEQFNDIEPTVLAFFGKTALGTLFDSEGGIDAAIATLDRLEGHIANLYPQDSLEPEATPEPITPIPDGLIVEPSDVDEQLTLPPAADVELTKTVEGEEGIRTYDTVADLASRKSKFLRGV